MINRKNSYVLLLLVACAPSGLAETPPHAVNYRIEKTATPFVRHEKLRILVSKSCVSDTGALGCRAVDAITRASAKVVEAAIAEGGNDPGAAICNNLRGLVTLGFDAKDNQLAFCRFSDRSLISTGSLYYWGRRNDASPKAKQ